MAITTHILEALFPVLALVVAGYIFRKKGFLGKDFWRAAESLTYFVLFPCLILYRLINADFSQFEISSLVIVVLAYFLILTLCTWLIDKKFLSLSHAPWTSFLQGSIRYNTFIALALSDKLFGEQLFALSALIVGLFITIVNIITIIAFSAEGRPSPVTIGMNLIKNPLVLASIIGIGINLSQINIPVFVSDTLSVFGRGALPLAILAVGAGLKIKSLTSIDSPIFYSSINKLLLSPVLMAILAFILIDDQSTRNLLIIFASIPTASAAYIMARKLGGDAELMASIITFQTIISTLSVTAILFLTL